MISFSYGLDDMLGKVYSKLQKTLVSTLDAWFGEDKNKETHCTSGYVLCNNATACKMHCALVALSCTT